MNEENLLDRIKELEKALLETLVLCRWTIRVEEDEAAKVGGEMPWRVKVYNDACATLHKGISK